MRVTALLLLVVGAGACRGCGARVNQLTPAELHVEPESLDFPDTFIGQVARRSVTVTNRGQQPAAVTWSTSAPFTVERLEFTLSGGESVEVAVDFSPSEPGPRDGRLTGSGLEVSLHGTGLEVPQCVAEVCHEASFDVSQAQCRTAPLADETSCLDTCVVDGRCRAGSCVGQARDCSDPDACTTDACGPSGCTHSPRTCPAPVNPCKVATCDSVTGCGEEDALDGTLCGPDLCTQSDVQVCIAGACVTRPRPSTGRCQNTWTSLAMPARNGRAVTYDSARQRTLAFGGRDGTPIFDDTWEFDGELWSQRFPPQSPPATTGAVLAFDSARRRGVLFGGERAGAALSAETWEWDGVTWLARVTPLAPLPRRNAAAVYDSARRKLVLFGGQGASAPLGDTWEWDGLRWTQVAASGPSPRTGHALAFDERRGRVVLVGGFDGAYQSDVWEWDGASWSQKQPSTSAGPRARHGLAYDADRQRVVMVFGATGPSSYADDVWEWDGLEWTRRSPPGSSPGLVLDPHAVWDAAHHRLTVVSSLELFAWDGSGWRAFKPSYRPGASVTFDSARGVAVLFGGQLIGAPDEFASETWEWDGARWTKRVTTPAPSGRYGAALTFDRARNRVVLFGGSTKLNQPGGVTGVDFDDTWEWDGSSWRQVTTSVKPPAGAFARLAFVPASQRSVLLTDSPPGRWSYDGTSWSQDAADTQPVGPHYADEVAQALTVLSPNRVGGVDRAQLAPTGWTTQSFTATGWTPALPNRIGAAFDASRSVALVQFLDTSNLARTWQFDGATFTQLQPRVTPRNGAMFYDSTRHKVMLHDGTDTWVYLP